MRTQANARTTIGLFLRVYLAMAGLLFMHARCEESSILEGATQVTESSYDQGDTDASNALIDGNFGTVSRTKKGSILLSFAFSMLNNRQTIELSTEKSIRSVLTVNSAGTSFGKERYYMGEAYVAVGSSLASLSKVSDVFFDTNWSTVSTSAATGQYVSIVRSNLSTNNNAKTYKNMMMLSEVRLYEMPNLMYTTGVTVTKLSSSSSSLVERLWQYPYKSIYSGAFYNIKGHTSSGNIAYALRSSLSDYKHVVGLKFDRSYTQHAIVILESQNIVYYDKTFQNFEIYIGDSPTYLSNVKCPGGPWMKDDASSYIAGKWQAGMEVWCNLTGMYTFLVADLSGMGSQTWVGAADLAIIGTFYHRVIAITKTTWDLTASSLSATFDISDIESEFETGTVFDIGIRAAATSDPAFTVSCSKVSTKNACTITKNDTSGGCKTYTVILESYNKLSTLSTPTTLYTDTITINYSPNLPPSGTEAAVTLVPGVTQTFDMISETAIQDFKDCWSATPHPVIPTELADFVTCTLSACTYDADASSAKALALEAGKSLQITQTMTVNSSTVTRTQPITVSYDLIRFEPDAVSDITIYRGITDTYDMPAIWDGSTNPLATVTFEGTCWPYWTYSILTGKMTYDGQTSCLTGTSIDNARVILTDSIGVSKTYSFVIKIENAVAPTLDTASTTLPAQTIMPAISSTWALADVVLGTQPLADSMTHEFSDTTFDAFVQVTKSGSAPTISVAFDGQLDHFVTKDNFGSSLTLKIKILDTRGLFTQYTQVINIDTPTPPSFESSLTPVMVKLNEHGQWLWPAITPGTYPFSQVGVNRIGLAPYLSLVGSDGAVSADPRGFKCDTASGCDDIKDIESQVINMVVTLYSIHKKDGNPLFEKSYFQKVTVDTYTYASFTTSIPKKLLHYGVPQTWTTSAVIDGTFPLQSQDAVPNDSTMASYFSHTWDAVAKTFTVTWNGGDAPNFTHSFTKIATEKGFNYLFVDTRSGSASSPQYNVFQLEWPGPPVFTGPSTQIGDKYYIPDFSFMPGQAATYDCPLIDSGHILYTATTIDFFAKFAAFVPTGLDSLSCQYTLSQADSLSYLEEAGNEDAIKYELKNSFGQKTTYWQKIIAQTPTKPTFDSQIPNASYTLGVAGTLMTLPSITEGTFAPAVPQSWDTSKFEIQTAYLGSKSIYYNGSYDASDKDKMTQTTTETVALLDNAGITNNDFNIEVQMLAPAAPTFATNPSDSPLEIMPGIALNHQLPDVLKGPLLYTKIQIDRQNLLGYLTMNKQNLEQPRLRMTQEKTLQLIDDGIAGSSVTVKLILFDEFDQSRQYDLVIKILEVVMPSFDSALSTISLMPNRPETFELPSVTPGTFPVSTIQITGPASGLNLVTYLTAAKSLTLEYSVTYDGNFASPDLLIEVGSTSAMTITLTNSVGLQQTFSQSFRILEMIMPSFDAALSTISLMPNRPETFELPSVTAGTFPVSTIQITGPASGLNLVTYLTAHKSLLEYSITYDGNFASPDLLIEAGNASSMTITLTNSADVPKTFPLSFTILEIIMPSFDTTLSAISLMPGRQEIFNLPSVTPGTFPNTSISITGPASGLNLVTYLTAAKSLALEFSVTYDGNFASPDLLIEAENTSAMAITLKNGVWGVPNVYTLSVTILEMIMPSFDTTLSAISLMPGRPETFELPSVTPGTYPVSTIQITGPASGLNLVTYLTAAKSLTLEYSVTYDGNFASPDLLIEAGNASSMTITLTNSADVPKTFPLSFQILTVIVPVFNPETIPTQTVMPGIAKQWSLPQIDKGTFDVVSVQVLSHQSHFSIAIDLLDLSSQLSFDDGATTALMRDLQGTSSKVDLRITNQIGQTNDYEQQITIETPVGPTFVATTVEQELLPGVAKTWSLPIIDEGTHTLKPISLVTDPEIEAYITLDSFARELTFDGHETSKALSSQTFSMVLTLENVLGDTSTTTQSVNFLPVNPPTFVPPPIDLEVKVREVNEWDLPSINHGSLLGTIVTVEIDPKIQEFLKFDTETSKFTFDGENEGTFEFVGSSFTTRLTLTSIIGEATSYEQTIGVTGCPISQESFDTKTSALSPKLELEALVGETTDFKIYSDIIELVNIALELTPDQAAACGDFDVALNSDYSFLELNKNKKEVNLLPLEGDQAGVFEDAYLELTLQDIKMQVPITAKTISCTIETIGFKKNSISIEYLIGSGTVQEDLPGISQKPDCGLPFNTIVQESIASNLDATALAAAITVDLDLGAIIIDTDDLKLIGEQVSIVFKVDVADAKYPIKTKKLIVDLVFSVEPPAFDMSDFTADPLTCSASDAQWTLNLPKIKNAEESEVTLSLLETDDFSPMFLHSGKTVTLEDSAKQDFSSGAYCPSQTEITLKFKLTHELMGDFEQSVTVPVEPKAKDDDTSGADTGSVAFDASKFTKSSSFNEKDKKGKAQVNVQPKEEPEKLEVAGLSMTPTGKLTLRFSKPIIEPRLKIDAPQVTNATTTTPEKTDNLRELQRLFNIEDAIKIKVKDADLDLEINKHIDLIKLVNVTQDSLVIQINFEEVNAITQDIQEPDILVITFILPNLLIDAETGKPLDKESLIHEIPLSPQFTAAQFAQLVEMGETAAKFGLTFSFWEIVICFALGKALHSMWVLINCMQFFVYMSLWQIKFPNITRFLLNELRKIALGEFMEGLEIGNTVGNSLGIPSETSSGTEEKVGEERLGSGNVSASLGVTLVLGSMAFVAIILVVLLLLWLRKRCKNMSEKNKQRLDGLKSKVFWNPLIRYTLLNALKLNMTAMTAYKTNLSDEANVSIASCIMFMFVFLPFFYAIILYRKNDELDKEKNIKAFGTLYQGRYVGEEISSKAWLFPFFFFFRRTAFVSATIYLFSWPSMQMLVHQLLTLVSIFYLCWDDQMFDTKAQRIIEVGSEFFMLLTCSLLAQFLVTNYNEEQFEILETYTCISFGILVVFNVMYVIYLLCVNCKIKKRKKWLEKQALEYQKAVERNEQNIKDEKKRQKLMKLAMKYPMIPLDESQIKEIQEAKLRKLNAKNQLASISEEEEGGSSHNNQNGDSKLIHVRAIPKRPDQTKQIHWTPEQAQNVTILGNASQLKNATKLEITEEINHVQRGKTDLEMLTSAKQSKKQKKKQMKKRAKSMSKMADKPVQDLVDLVDDIIDDRRGEVHQRQQIPFNDTLRQRPFIPLKNHHHSLQPVGLMQLANLQVREEVVKGKDSVSRLDISDAENVLEAMVDSPRRRPFIKRDVDIFKLNNVQFDRHKTHN